VSIGDGLLHDIVVTLKKWNVPWKRACFSSVPPNPFKGYNMRYMIAIIAVLFNCALACSQEDRAVVKSQSAPAQTSIAVQSEGLGLQASANISTRAFPSLDQSGSQTGDFVFVNGAAYMRLGGSLFPLSGGGASGCFSLDLPQRIERIDDFILRLEDRKAAKLRDHQDKKTLSSSPRE
jgi:hypothetical protein